jgi:ABC-type amino acid transport substrate-binding protein
MRNTDNIGSIYASSSADFLNNNDIQIKELYTDIEEGLLALSARDIEVLVYDKTALDYTIGQLQLSNKVSLLQVSFNQQYRSFYLPKNSPHLSWINPLLVRETNEASWPELLKKYNLHVE